MTQLAKIKALSSKVAQLFCNSFPVVKSYLAMALSVADTGHTTSQVHDDVALKVMVSVAAFVVIVILVHAANVRVSFVVSATTSD